MTSRERILTAINHQEPDRVPRDLGGTESSGLAAYSLFNLRKHLRMPRDLKIFEPYQEKLFRYVKKSFDAPLLFHSCGAVRDFIPDLIEVGVDALNPVQVSAAGMNPAELKRDFGNDITFWGGGVDTQTVLNNRTPAAVKEAVRRTVDTLAPGGGFIFCQVHNIQPDVPPENVVAMFEELDQ